MTTVNILIYTDKRDISLVDDDGTKRVTILKKLLETKRLAFAEFKLEVINRYEGFTDPSKPKTPQKLSRTLLERFDEIWFFGLYQKKVDGPFEETFGGPDNELDDDEVRELEGWMARGGVLMAGDHSLYAPGGSEADPPDTYLCLGRALGHRVPRAGQLRKWKGPPTVKFESSFNTLVRTATDSEMNPDLQNDVLPQTLVLVTSGPQQAPHRIFLGREQVIALFPDHLHEGEVEIPEVLNSQWPPFKEKDEKKKERPVVVAYGCDKRSCDSTPVLAVYDGDKFGVGRIAADSSWHHYLNINLQAWADGSQDSTLDLLAQFFQNLALYLAPLALRQKMSADMIKWLLGHPEVQEERGNRPLVVGKVALHYLSKITTRCEVSELLQVELSTHQGMDSERFNLPTLDSGTGFVTTQELVVGAIINRFYRTASEQLNPNVASLKKEKATDREIITEGLRDAYNAQEALLKEIASATSDSLELLDRTDSTKDST
jgi:hypothetical protein